MWDKDILELFDIPESHLPIVKTSSGVIGEMHPEILGAPIPIEGDAGDKQAATNDKYCTKQRMAANTYQQMRR